MTLTIRERAIIMYFLSFVAMLVVGISIFGIMGITLYLLWATMLGDWALLVEAVLIILWLWLLIKIIAAGMHYAHIIEANPVAIPSGVG